MKNQRWNPFLVLGVIMGILIALLMVVWRQLPPREPAPTVLKNP